MQHRYLHSQKIRPALKLAHILRRKRGTSMIIWSDDCGSCLCNLPHSMEVHMQQVERARAELQAEIAELRALNRDIYEDYDEEEEEYEEDETGGKEGGTSC
jgi:chromosome segregation ATPase